MKEIDIVNVIGDYDELLTMANTIFMKKFDWFEENYRVNILGIYNDYEIICACEYIGKDKNKREDLYLVIPYEYLVSKDIDDIAISKLDVKEYSGNYQ